MDRSSGNATLTPGLGLVGWIRFSDRDPVCLFHASLTFVRDVSGQADQPE